MTALTFHLFSDPKFLPVIQFPSGGCMRGVGFSMLVIDDLNQLNQLNQRWR